MQLSHQQNFKNIFNVLGGFMAFVLGHIHGYPQSHGVHRPWVGHPWLKVSKYQSPQYIGPWTISKRASLLSHMFWILNRKALGIHGFKAKVIFIVVNTFSHGLRYRIVFLCSNLMIRKPKQAYSEVDSGANQKKLFHWGWEQATWVRGLVSIGGFLLRAQEFG